MSDHHIDAVALLQALLDHGCVVIPLSEDDRGSFDDLLGTACASHLVTVSADGEIAPATTGCRRLADAGAPVHPLLQSMAAEGTPGFVIFTSGVLMTRRCS